MGGGGTGLPNPSSIVDEYIDRKCELEVTSLPYRDQRFSRDACTQPDFSSELLVLRAWEDVS